MRSVSTDKWNAGEFGGSISNQIQVVIQADDRMRILSRPAELSTCSTADIKKREKPVVKYIESDPLSYPPQ
jgi:hypothetical protein